MFISFASPGGSSWPMDREYELNDEGGSGRYLPSEFYSRNDEGGLP
ncbi:hypothetical protein J2W28_002404 [Variovorax boronicumulans]|nr:hypothetical protein [Variovorax boronicumulans]MDP9991379.1 hypothetical protein [Variovorax boronicumulans]MDQ0003257.1 hypothetical protein [Variovorax boronicumulans]